MKKPGKRWIVLLISLFAAPFVLYFWFPGTAFHILLKIERGLAGYDQYGIDVDGVHFEYLAGGRGETLVLLHGFGGNKDHWTRIGRHLTPHFSVIAPDLPGFGESTSTPDADYTPPVQIDRLHAFIRGMDIKAFHLGGNSMGGNLAGAYAARYPDSVKSLFLLAPGGVSSAQPSEMHRIRTSGRPNPLIAKNVEEYERLMDFVFVKRPFIPRAIKKYLVREAVAHQHINRWIYEQLDKSRKAQNLEMLLKGSDIPTLIVWGREDRVLHVSGADMLKTVLPRAETVVFDQVGHLPMVEKPEATADAYIRFLEKKTPP